MDEIKKAKEKLQREFELQKYSNQSVSSVIGKPVLDKLFFFCEQDVRFARLVLRSIPTYKQFLSKVEDWVKKEKLNGISDIDTYRKAVKFYAENADVNFNISIKLADDALSVEVTEDELAAVLKTQDEIRKANDEAKAKAEAERLEKIKTLMPEAVTPLKTEKKTKPENIQLSLF